MKACDTLRVNFCAVLLILFLFPVVREIFVANSSYISNSINIPSYFQPHRTDCPESIAANVRWPSTAAGHRSASVPWCLDERSYLITRECLATGNWTPIDRETCTKQMVPIDSISHRCPDGLGSPLRHNATHVLCARLEPLEGATQEYADWWTQAGYCAQFGAERTVFDLDAVELNALAAFLDMRTVWLAAHWSRTNRLRWQLPGSGASGRIVQLSSTAVDQAQRRGSGCAAMRFARADDGTWRMRFMKRSCTERRTMLCVYAEAEPLVRLACKDDRRTTRFASMQSHCYGMQELRQDDLGPNNLYKMINEQDAVIARQLMVGTTTPEVDPTAGPPIRWVFNALNDAELNSRNVSTERWLSAPVEQRTFVNWAVAANYPKEGSEQDVLVCDKDAQWFIAPSVDVQYALVAVNDVEYPYQIVDMSLRFVPDVESYLSLTISNIWRLWRSDTDTDMEQFVNCFHSDELQETVQKVAIHRTSESEFSASLPIISSGHYWCEGYEIPRIQLVRSQTYYVDHFDDFVGTVWRQMDFNNATIDIRDWINQAVALTNAAAPLDLSIGVDNVTVRLQQFVRPRPVPGEFLRIDFTVSVRFTAGAPFEPDAKLLVHTSAEILRVAAKHERLMAALRYPPFHFPNINSTAFCLPEFRNGETLWPGGRLGEVHTSIELCWVAVGRPVMRRCAGNATQLGAMWMDVTGRDCIATVIGEATQQLHDTAQTFRSAEQTAEVLSGVNQLTQAHQLTAFDVVSIGSIMARAQQLNVNRTLSGGEMIDMLDIYDGIMALDVKQTRAAANLNATNILLASLDGLLSNWQTAAEEVDGPAALSVRELRTTDGKRWRHLQVYLLDPIATNMSGVLLRSGSDSIEFVSSQQRIADMFAVDDLEVAAFLTYDCLAQLPALSKLVVCVFNNDVLFQTPDERRLTHLRSRIISISIPNVDTTALPTPLPLFFRHDPTQTNETCAFWPLDNKRDWSHDGLERIANTTRIVQYNVTHLTNFALIINDRLAFSATDSANLFIITVVGSALSLVGVLGIFLTALRFSKWRTKASNQLLLQLSTAIAAMLLLFLFVDNQQALADRSVCIAMGAIMHYLVLVTFAWMLVMAYLQFMRYVVVFVRMRSDRYVLKLSCISWLAPALPVTVVLLVDPDLYAPVHPATTTTIEAEAAALDIDEAGATATAAAMCYPSGYALYAGLMAPIALIIVCNMLVFVSVVYNLLQVQMANRSIVLAQLRVSTFLFFLLGLTWVFGFFSRSNGPSVMFAYLFCATATLQGLVLFVYFVVLEPGTRQLWTNDLRTVCGIRRKGSLTVEANV